jgi:hypothetical protein
MLAIFIVPLQHPVLQWGEWGLLQCVVVAMAYQKGRLQVGVGVLAFELNAVYALSGLPRTLVGSGPYTEATQIYLAALALFAIVMLLWRPDRNGPFAAMMDDGRGHRELKVFILLAFAGSLLIQFLSFESVLEFVAFWFKGSYLEKHTAHKPLLTINQGLLQMIGVACALYLSTDRSGTSARRKKRLPVLAVFTLTLVFLFLYGKRWLLLSPIFTWLLVRSLIYRQGIRLRTVVIWAVPFWLAFTLFAQTRAGWTQGDWGSVAESITTASTVSLDPVADTEQGVGTFSLKNTQDLIHEGRWKLAYGGTYLEIFPLTWATLQGEPYEIIQTRYNRDLFYEEFYAVGGTRAYGFLAEGYANGAVGGALLAALALILGLLWIENRLNRLRSLSLLVMGIYLQIFLVFMIRTDITDCLRALGLMGGTWVVLFSFSRVVLSLMDQGHQHKDVGATAQQERAGRADGPEADHEERA